ncbi:hypothetical protein N8289_03385, partial [Flavobacteriales bacterium]|nr:hypothetical protein [Flavobacteriales bacterium]
YKTIFTPKPEVKMDLTETNQLHKDALYWFSINKNKELPLADIEGEKFFRNGSTFLSTRAKGIYKPKTIDFALSIKVLINNPYDDVIQEFGDGSWKIKYHKEDNVDWTNDGLVKCMEYNVPVGLFYQTKERSPSKYKICGLGIINHFDGEYFYINSIKEDDELKFDWNPLDKINNDVKNRVKNVYVINEENMGQLSKIEKEIIELYKDEPFLAMQKFKKFYKSKIKKARQSEINNAFEQLINQL